MSESIEFSFTQYPSSEASLFLPTVHFCDIFSTFCLMFSLANYQAVTSLLATEVSIAA